MSLVTEAGNHPEQQLDQLAMTSNNDSNTQAEHQTNERNIPPVKEALNHAANESISSTVATAHDSNALAEHELSQPTAASTNSSEHHAEGEPNQRTMTSTSDADNRAGREAVIRDLSVSQLHAEIGNMMKHTHEPWTHDDSDIDSDFETETNFAEKLTYQKQYDREQERLRKEEEDALFIQDQEDEEERALFLTDDEASDEASSLSGRKRNRQAVDDDYDDDVEEPTTKRRKKSASVRVGRPKGSKNKKKNATQASMAFNPDRIIGADAAGDYASVSHLPSQPILGAAKTRKDAFKRFYASIPIAQQEEARSDKVVLDNAMKAFDGRPFPPKYYAAEGVLMRGMKSSLKHYQVVGAGFMRTQEQRADPPGGILADEMGLGKTVMILANVVNGKIAREMYNRHNKDRLGFKPLPKPTLIVVPASLLQQWRTEVKKHVHYNPGVKKTALSAEQNAGLHKVGDFYSIQRLAMSPDEQVKIMEDHDIVFATYTAVQQFFPKMRAPKELTTAEKKEAWYKEQFDNDAGPLHKVNWLRVVLDEAHYIKNHLSHTSKACRWLRARYHWAVTATPVQNRLEEFYPYFKFIRHPMVSSMRQFAASCCVTGDEQFEDEDQAAIEIAKRERRLMAILSTCMIRRTLNDQMFGAKLIDVPKPEEPFIMEIEFTPVERAVYNILRQKFKRRVEEMKRAGTLQKQLKSVFTMILRLRQATDHILLLQDTFVNLAHCGDLEDLKAILNRDDATSEADGLRNMMELRYMLDVMKPMISERHGSCKIVTQARQHINDLKHAMPDFDEKSAGRVHGFIGFDYSKYITSLGTGRDYAKIVKQTRCAECNEIPKDAHITSCKHIYCKDCLQSITNKAARLGKDGALCSKCSEQFVTSRKCSEGEAPAESDSGSSDDSSNESMDGTQKQKKVKKKRPAKSNSWLNMEGPIAPSAKTMALKTQILKWMSEEPDVKIIVYSQFVQFLDIIKRVCEGEKWKHRCFTGHMNLKARDKAISDFNNPKKGVQLLLASLKCGSLGLNLTSASRVILMESWWNVSVEAQAFGRVLRPGQDKTTSMTRLMVRNTIDEHLLHMKQRKSGEIDGVMGEEGDFTFDLDELMSLFRPLDADGNENSYIIAEDGGQSGDNLDRFVDATENDEYESMHNDH